MMWFLPTNSAPFLPMSTMAFHFPEHIMLPLASRLFVTQLFPLPSSQTFIPPVRLSFGVISPRKRSQTPHWVDAPSLSSNRIKELFCHSSNMVALSTDFINTT